MPINVGDKYGRLTVVEPATKRGFWRCLCECGRRTVVRGSNLMATLTGRGTKSCGCIGKGWNSRLRNYQKGGETNGIQ